MGFRVMLQLRVARKERLEGLSLYFVLHISLHVLIMFLCVGGKCVFISFAFFFFSCLNVIFFSLFCCCGLSCYIMICPFIYFFIYLFLYFLFEHYFLFIILLLLLLFIILYYDLSFYLFIYLFIHSFLYLSYSVGSLFQISSSLLFVCFFYIFPFFLLFIHIIFIPYLPSQSLGQELQKQRRKEKKRKRGIENKK